MIDWGTLLSKVLAIVLRRVPVVPPELAAAAVEVVAEVANEVAADFRDEPTQPLSSKDVAHIQEQMRAATKHANPPPRKKAKP
jgi:hypothetical protein